jgi:hypothetical protein
MLSAVREIATASVSEPPSRTGYFKVRVKALGVTRWVICPELPAERIYEEWLYIGADGIPQIYWSQQLNGVILI